jgi:hypothetical protein
MNFSVEAVVLNDEYHSVWFNIYIFLLTIETLLVVVTNSDE